ncbi:MAG: hypothetical protein L0Y39_10355 [Methylococcaceae bacterium]|nr:hypothetical protein [Methylococcaceae bacterium]
MKFNSFPWFLIAAMFGLCAWFRFALVEPAEVGFFCDRGGQTFECELRRIIIQIFTSGLGYVALFTGFLALVTRSGFAGFIAAWVGAAGLILYNWDYSAVAFLLGVLILARAQLNHYRDQH